MVLAGHTSLSEIKHQVKTGSSRTYIAVIVKYQVLTGSSRTYTSVIVKYQVLTGSSRTYISVIVKYQVLTGSSRTYISVIVQTLIGSISTGHPSSLSQRSGQIKFPLLNMKSY